MTDILISYGIAGMFIAAFLAGSILPFSSEVVLVGLQALGVAPIPLVISATAGNVLGGIMNYGVGRLGKVEWMEKYLHIKEEKLNKALRLMKGRGAWMGLLSVVPFIGDVITVALGFMRSNMAITFFCMFVGKAARYILLASGVHIIEN